MVSTISFTQANLQHSTAASRVLSKTVNVKEVQPIDLELVSFRVARRLGCCQDSLVGTW
jgi:hypothetical protein